MTAYVALGAAVRRARPRGEFGAAYVDIASASRRCCRARGGDKCGTLPETNVLRVRLIYVIPSRNPHPTKVALKMHIACEMHLR